MKKVLILSIIALFGSTSFSQISGLFGKKNLLSFQFIQSPAYASRQPVKMTSDTESKMYLAPFAFVMNVGYERILTRKISFGLDYTFGMGRMAMAGADQSFDPFNGNYGVPSEIALEDPIYHNHGITFSASFYLKDFAPIGSYIKTGLGFSMNTTNQTVAVGHLEGYDSSLNNQLQFTSRRKYSVVKTGERQIKATRGMINIALLWGRNWLLTKRLMLNLELGTKWNFSIDGKSVVNSPFNALTSSIGSGGEYTSLNYKNVDRNLFTTKARQELIMINLGLKIAL